MASCWSATGGTTASWCSSEGRRSARWLLGRIPEPRAASSIARGSRGALSRDVDTATCGGPKGRAARTSSGRRARLRLDLLDELLQVELLRLVVDLLAGHLDGEDAVAAGLELHAFDAAAEVLEERLLDVERAREVAAGDAVLDLDGGVWHVGSPSVLDAVRATSPTTISEPAARRCRPPAGTGSVGRVRRGGSVEGRSARSSGRVVRPRRPRHEYPP